MPVYTVTHKETSEKKTLVCSYDELNEFLSDNNDWKQNLSAPLLVSQHGGLLSRTDGGWNEVLTSIKQGSGAGNTIRTK